MRESLEQLDLLLIQVAKSRIRLCRRKPGSAVHANHLLQKAIALVKALAIALCNADRVRARILE